VGIIRNAAALIVTILALSGCQSLQRVNDSMVENYDHTRERIHDWAYGHDHADPYGAEAEPLHLSEPRYCYETRSDIVCHRTPQPGQQHRLVGVQ